jgi:hypothetical protein
LEKISFPPTFLNISDHAFENCKSLKKIEFEPAESEENPNNVSIQESAFKGCENLREIFLNDRKNGSISGTAFSSSGSGFNDGIYFGQITSNDDLPFDSNTLAKNIY